MFWEKLVECLILSGVHLSWSLNCSDFFCLCFCSIHIVFACRQKDILFYKPFTTCENLIYLCPLNLSTLFLWHRIVLYLGLHVTVSSVQEDNICERHTMLWPKAVKVASPTDESQSGYICWNFVSKQKVWYQFLTWSDWFQSSYISYTFGQSDYYLFLRISPTGNEFRHILV